MFSKSFTYGLRASLLLAGQPEGTYLKVHELSEALDIPASMLAKTLHQLGVAGVVDTLRGPHGGCRWNPKSDALSLADLARLFDEPALKGECLLGLVHEPGMDCLLPDLGPDNIAKAMASVSLREAARHYAKNRQTTRKS